MTTPPQDERCVCGHPRIEHGLSGCWAGWLVGTGKEGCSCTRQFTRAEKESKS